MDLQTLTFIPKFMQEVVGFKSNIKGHHTRWEQRTKGLGSKHLFQVLCRWQRMANHEVQEQATNDTWLPTWTSIRMWCENGEGLPSLPIRDPFPVPYKSLWGNESINANTKNHEKEATRVSKATTNHVFILKGIEVWEVGMVGNKSYAQVMADYVDSWKCTLEELLKPIPSQPATLMEGFWLATDWRRCHGAIGLDIIAGYEDMTPKDEVEIDYCELVKDTPDYVERYPTDNFVLVSKPLHYTVNSKCSGGCQHKK